MNNKYRQEMRTYAWNYFSLHAGQRLSTFNFYLILAALLVTPCISAFTKPDLMSRKIAIGLGMLLAVISMIFFKLDQRNKALVRNAEAALRFLDEQVELQDCNGVPHECKLFSRDDYHTNQAKKIKSFWPSKLYLSYSDCFRYIFTIFIILGLAIAGLAVFFGGK